MFHHHQGIGVTFFVLYCAYSLSFWYGGTLVYKGEITAGDVLIVFFSAVIGAMSLGQAAPSLSAIAGGRGAAVNIFAVIDREPKIDSLSEEGWLH